MFTTIVVGTDGSETAGAAVAAAIDLAARVGARLDVVSAYEPSAVRRLREAPPETQESPGDRRWAVNLREEVDATLREAAARAEAAGVAAAVFAREGDPAGAILDVAEERGAGLIVVGHSGRTGAERFLLGSVPHKVSHHAPCSVLIIRTA